MSITLSPGVLSYEHPSGASVVRGAISNRLLAIGMARKGPIGEPVFVQTYEQFTDTFGEDLTYGELGLQMRQFFTAGGSDAVVVRGAAGAVPADTTLQSECGNPALEVTALGEGTHGNQIRIDVDYDTPTPELTFNATFYREVVDSLGRLGRVDEEIFRDLSLDPMAANFVETKINGVSDLVRVRNVAAAPDLMVAHAAEVYSQSANFPGSAAAFNAALAAAAGTHLVLEIDGLATPPIDISAAANASQIATQINNALTALSLDAEVSGTLVGGGLRIAATSNGTRSIRVMPAPSSDITAELGLGGNQGGIEVGLYSALRPQMTGISSRIFTAPGVITALLNLASAAGNPARTATFNDGGADTDVVWGVASPDLTTTRLRAELDSLVAVLNASALDETWVFERIGMRIRGLRIDGAQAQSEAASLTGDAAGLNASAVRASFALGQDGGAAGVDGTAPVLANYLDYYQTIARKVSIFNMMILPRGHGQTDAARSSIWGAASSFCRDENALLIIDPRSENNAWSDVFEITDQAEITDFKSGILPEVSCTFWPRVRTPLGTSQVHIDPAGTIAGVMAATIAKSGVWNTAAGLGAPLSGVTGLEYGMTDAENGVINPRGINALRAKSTGNVVWGGRTLAGDDAFANRDFAYISVRMTTDYIKNSISRALESFVFKNNNADTWAQIEMMCRAFLHDLYKKGAFRGTKVDDAYEARCNNLTTSPTDIQLGIMNVWVKFAPNFPAEFIHLHIQHKFEQPSF